jgi:membrane protein
MASESVGDSDSSRPWWVELRGLTWRLITQTVGICLRYRVTGLAAEAAFFAILSLPPLIFGLTASIAYIVGRVDPGAIDSFTQVTLDLSSRALTEDAVDQVVRRTLHEVTTGARFDLISIGFILSLWSGSRALNVFVDTITIMYGYGGRRGIVRTRMLSFSLYVVGLIVGVVVIPLTLAGPELAAEFLPERLSFLNSLYRPLVALVSVGFLATLFHVAVPVRRLWRYNLPGAIFALLVWIFGSVALRWVLTHATTSIFGPLGPPIAILIWLYLLAIAVLIGAALNAAFDRIWREDPPRLGWSKRS